MSHTLAFVLSLWGIGGVWTGAMILLTRGFRR